MPNLKEEWLRLDPDGNFQLEIWATDGTFNIWGFIGKYELQGNKIILITTEDEKETGTLEGDTITIDHDKFIKKRFLQNH